jgi:UPF0755 protein
VRPWLQSILLSLLVTAAAFTFWLRYELATSFFAGGAEVFVEIPRGSGTNAIAAALKAGGVLRHNLPFYLFVRWNRLGRHLRAGEYRFSSAATVSQVAQRLVQGDVFFRTVTVPEGLTARETVALIARNGLGNENALVELLGRVDWISDLDSRAASLEGYLFPETYRFSRHITAEEIVKSMVSQFRRATSAMLAAHHPAPDWTIAQIVTLASIIEKEARNPEERRLVASVLMNRLRIKMPLACDPTIIYALKLAGRYDGNLHKADLGLESPYNTYLRQGLPPGPIANPGYDSLLAVLEPAESNFLYYVSRNDGTHYFSKDLRTHLLAVSRYQPRK